MIVQVNETPPDGESGQVGVVAQVELFHNTASVGFDRAETQAQFPGDLPGGGAACQPNQDLHFPIREAGFGCF